MSPLHALVLGIVQGLGEFIPISSTAHLVLVPWFFSWPDPGLSFDVALHLGTLVAVLGYFWREWIALATGFISGVRTRRFGEPRARLSGLLIIGTVPGIIAGILLEKSAETTFRDPRLIAVMLMVLALLLLAAEALSKRYKDVDKLSLWDVVLVGIAQAFAIIPGISRSGATITMALFRGARRTAAARFSFLLGTPIIAGAGAKNAFDIVRDGVPVDERFAFAIGVVSAAAVGYLAIALLLRYLQRNSTLVFVAYRLALGLAVLALAFARGS